MKTVLMVAFLLIGCGTDTAGFGITGHDGGAPDTDFADATIVVDSGAPDTAKPYDVQQPPDASMPEPDASLLAPDTAPPEKIPDHIVPRRVGLPCDTDSQCGAHAGSCIAGRCTACMGAACGTCAVGETDGAHCPIRGTTASACSYCVDDPRLWCDRTTPCPSGRCKTPDCN